MTDKQIDAAKRTLPNWREIPYKDWTVEQKTLRKELSWRGYINSCLCYGMTYLIIKDGELCVDADSRKLYLDEFITDERALEIYHEQVEDFKKAKVLRNVGSDSEGNCYNSIKWADD